MVSVLTIPPTFSSAPDQEIPLCQRLVREPLVAEGGVAAQIWMPQSLSRPDSKLQLLQTILQDDVLEKC